MQTTLFTEPEPAITTTCYNEGCKNQAKNLIGCNWLCNTCLWNDNWFTNNTMDIEDTKHMIEYFEQLSFDYLLEQFDPEQYHNLSYPITEIEI